MRTVHSRGYRFVAEIKARAPAYRLAHAGRMFPYPEAAQAARLRAALMGAGLGQLWSRLGGLDLGDGARHAAGI